MLFVFLKERLRGCRDGGPGVEVFQNENLQDLVEVLNSGAIQVLLIVIKCVPHRREGGGDEVEDLYTCQTQNNDHQTQLQKGDAVLVLVLYYTSVQEWYVIIQNVAHRSIGPEILHADGMMHKLVHGV